MMSRIFTGVCGRLVTSHMQENKVKHCLSYHVKLRLIDKQTNINNTMTTINITWHKAQKNIVTLAGKLKTAKNKPN